MTLTVPDLGWNEEIRSFVVKVTEHWIVSVTPMIFNHRIVLSDARDWKYTYVAGWCYDGPTPAMLAAEVFDPETEQAPVGYKKVAADRRVSLWICPACGIPAYEPRTDCHDFS